MCTNARLETVHTAPTFREAYRRRRCLVPVSAFFEYDAPPGWKKGDPKRRWDISWPPSGSADPVRYFAGLWDQSHPSDHDGPLISFTFITGPAGGEFSQARPDTGKPLHDRQARVLTAEQGMAWLDLEGPGRDLLAAPDVQGGLTLTECPRT